MFAPSASAAEPLNAPAVTGKLVPPIETTATGLASATVPVTATGVWLVKLPAAGAPIVISGPCVSRVTATSALALPAALLAVAVSVCVPSASVSVALQLVPPTAAAWPFTVTAAPAETVPVTTTAELASAAPFAGLVIATTGGLGRGGVPTGIPIFALPSGPSVPWMRTPNTQPCVEAPVSCATLTPVNTKLALSIGPPLPEPGKPSCTPSPRS